MRTQLAAGVLVALLAVGGTGCSVAAGETARTTAAAGQPGAAAAVQDAPPPSPAAAAERVGSVVPEEPVSIALPDGVVVPVRSVATTANGVLDVPSDIRVAGWWRGGSRIGDPFGSTLIAAHVDSTTQGLGPFAGLLSVRPGDRITVGTSTLRQTFAVRALRLRPRNAIGSQSYLHSPDGERRLTLVTCASPYVKALGGYQNLAVVVAVPVGDPVPKAAG